MSLLYLPYREIGVITNDSPVYITRLGNENFLTVSIGKSFQVMRVDKLTTCLISKPCNSDITHLVTKNNATFVATEDNKVIKFKRADIVCELGKHSAKISGLYSVGDILLSTDISGEIQVFDTKKNSLLNSMKTLNEGQLLVAAHPPTYINKFLFGLSNGHVELWNVRTGKHLYSFQSHIACLTEEEKKNMAISCIGAAPAVDVMVFGLRNGHIFVINIKLDQILFHFKQVGEVTDVSFRTDAAADKCPFLVSASSHGHLYTWKIGGGMNAVGSFLSKSSKLIHTVKRAHQGQLRTAQFLHGEPLLISAGTDNAVKVWIFDSPDGAPRLLRSRQGHVKYAADLSFFGDVSYDSQFGHGVAGQASGLISSDGGGQLLFSRVDRYGLMDKFSTAKLDNSEFLHGKPLPGVLAYDLSFLSNNPWGNLVSIHRHWAHACVWKVEDKAATGTVLSVPTTFMQRQQELHCSAVACSPCGHFAVVGYANGWLCKFNIQSGIFRGSFPKEQMATHTNIIDQTSDSNSRNANSNSNVSAHSASVCGVFVDVTSAVLVSASTDGQLCFWNLHEHRLLKTEYFSEGIEKIVGHRDTNFVAVVTKDHTIRVFDIFAMRLMRVFVHGHSQSVIGLCFSPDGRRLLSSCAAKSLRVWDMATGRCVSWMHFSEAVNSMCFTPNGDLVIAREHMRGILLAVDRSLTESVAINHEPVQPVDMSEALIDMSDHSSSSSSEDAMVMAGNTAADDQTTALTLLDNNNNADSDAATTSTGLQFSSVPKAYWSKIFKFEALKKKKNVVAPMKKASTPFFLNSFASGTAEVSSSSVAKESSSESAAAVSSRIMHFQDHSSGKLAKFLAASNSSQAILQFLMALSPSDVESEFRLLCPFEGNVVALKRTQSLLAHFVSLLKNKTAYELIQAYLHCLLTVHSGKIMKSFSMKQEVLQLKDELHSSSDRIQVLLHTCLCLIKVHLEIQLL